MDLGHVKENISSMMSQGAPESDIDAYIQMEGVTLEQLQAPNAPPIPQAAMPQDPLRTVYQGEVLPFSKNAQGDISFDSDAGVLGMIKNAVSSVGDAKRGKLNVADEINNMGYFEPMKPGGAMSRAGEAALVLGPASVAKALPLASANKLAARSMKAPTAKQLKAETSKGYDAAWNSGLELKGTTIKALADDMERELINSAKISENNPGMYGLLRRLQSVPEGGFMEAKFFDAFRRELSDIPYGDKEYGSAKIIKDKLDGFLAQLTEKDAVPGTSSGLPQSVSKSLTEARGNAAAGFRGGRIDSLQKTAETRAAAANSGKNIDATYRGKLASFLDSPKKMRGINSTEESAIRKVVQGKFSKNTARKIGNMLGGGGGVGLTVLTSIAAAGGAIVSPLAAALAAGGTIAVGSGARGVANRMSKKEVEALAGLMRKRSPLYSKMLQQGGQSAPKQGRFSRSFTGEVSN